MILALLFKDELKGFYRSNVMMALWIGLPLLSVITFLFLPGKNEQISITYTTASIISSIGGWLAAMMLAIHIIHEKSHHVYELFLVRPVKRSQIILAKYFAVFSCVMSATIFSLLLSFLLDHFLFKKAVYGGFSEIIKSFIISMSIISIECAAGAFVGMLVSTVLVGVISVVLTHNIAALTIMIPIMLKSKNTILFALIAGIVLSVTLLYIAIALFQRKQF
jgi:ABC-2 type transport system permease protein